MTDRSIDMLSLAEIPLVMGLYNQIYHPTRNEAFFARRLEGRPNPLMLVALVNDQPAGLFLGYEEQPEVYRHWLYGVLPAWQGQGLGSSLMTAVDAWAGEQGYVRSHLECDNRHREMLHLALAHGYDIAGTRWDEDQHAHVVLLGKSVVQADAA